MDEQAHYLCPYCGEEIIIPVDLSQGEQQEYVEDCPVCCSPVVITLEIQEDGSISCQATPE